MSADDHATDAPGHPGAGANHATDAHGDDRGHDDHAHADETLGPLDAAAWGAGILGLAVAIVIAACLSIGTTGLG